MQINQLLTLGNATLRAHILDQQAREIRNKLREYSRGGFWTSTSLDEHLQKLTISVKLPIYLQFAPEDTSPACVMFQAHEDAQGDAKGQAYARLRYPSIQVGMIGAKKGTALFIDAWSDPFTPPVIPSLPIADREAITLDPAVTLNGNIKPYNHNQLPTGCDL
jgi:hypothetical protein